MTRSTRGPDRQRAERAIADFLSALGHDPHSDPELAQTPARVTAAYLDELLCGYAMDPAQVLSDSVVTPSQGSVVALRDIETSTMCPHHLMPGSGVVHVAYVPADKMVGLGALSRLVDCFARRFTLQETLVENVAQALIDHLDARGAACAAVLSPTCLTARGERRHGATAISFAARGVMQAGQPLHESALSLLQVQVQP